MNRSLPGPAVAVALSLVLAACASRKEIPVTSAEAVAAQVDKGDEVAITSKNGKRYRFVVTKITNKALYGDGYRVSYEEMQTIELKNADGVFKRLGEKLF